MYKVVFYKDKSNKSEITELLDKLYTQSKTNKNARINHDKMVAYMGLLEQYGTYIGEPVVKHIMDNIWELRPLKNRVFFFYWKDNKFVMLHHFIKKSNKTPQKEIDLAKAKLKDYIERYGK